MVPANKHTKCSRCGNRKRAARLDQPNTRWHGSSYQKQPTLTHSRQTIISHKQCTIDWRNMFQRRRTYNINTCQTWAINWLSVPAKAILTGWQASLFTRCCQSLRSAMHQPWNIPVIQKDQNNFNVHAYHYANFERTLCISTSVLWAAVSTDTADQLGLKGAIRSS